LTEQGMVLSTCNRTEIYSVNGDKPHHEELASRFLPKYSGVPENDLKPFLYSLTGQDVVRHLFRVSAGLDSMIVGEHEVLGQVRRALEDAEETRLVQNPLLNLFRSSVRVGRRVREETSISRNALSVSAAGVELAKNVFGNIQNCKVLVIAAGEAGQLAVKALIKSGIPNVIIASRDLENAAILAASLGGTAIPFHHFGEALSTVDIVISCSSAPHFVIELSAVQQAMQNRHNKPILFIDLAVPRDIHPDIKGLANVHLYDIDDLNEICITNRSRREKQIGKAEIIINEEVSKFMVWWDSLDTVPTITALMEKAEKIRRQQLETALPKFKNLCVEDRAQIEAMTQAMIKKLLHDPLTVLKKNGKGSSSAQNLRELFKLED
ncbi:MAG: glutamyl-tRNA reductase, partial [Dehalococcoidia bacterium]|nr:glutamyl-tRNA reductase [Dehalococcoidia bacterium]